MIILLGFAFVVGLITILAPCIWPLLPVVLSTSSTGGKGKPFGITLGIMLSFAFFTLTLSYIVKIIPFDPNVLRIFAVIVIGFLGLILIIPYLNQLVEGWVSRLSGKIGINNKGNGFWSGFITGISLGIVWTPCAGPILATIATLSATQKVNTQLVLVTIVYVIGIGIPLLLFATLGNRIFSKSRFVAKYTGKIQQIFGVIMILTAIGIATNLDKTLEANLLNAFPSIANITTNFESNPAIKNQLNNLKNEATHLSLPSNLSSYGNAPDFTGGTKWLNLPSGQNALTLSQLKGKVVLVDFWTYTCINCIRTLPHLTHWYDKYKDKGFVIVGVHTPEFEFEKKTENVADAIKRFNINYPVVQDNDYTIWSAYQNQYWPAEYLIDAKGIVRRTHFGEGEYDQMEGAIQSLLKEAGHSANMPFDTIPDTAPQNSISPETYVGTARMERVAQQVNAGTQTFSAPNAIPTDNFAFLGTWNIETQFAMSTAGSQLLFHFTASHVYLVMHPQSSGNQVKVYLDNKLISPNQSGNDVKNGIVTLDSERLYDLVDTHGLPENHILKLEFLQDGIESFAFTFG